MSYLSFHKTNLRLLAELEKLHGEESGFSPRWLTVQLTPLLLTVPTASLFLEIEIYKISRNVLNFLSLVKLYRSGGQKLGWKMLEYQFIYLYFIFIYIYFYIECNLFVYRLPCLCMWIINVNHLRSQHVQCIYPLTTPFSELTHLYFCTISF